MKASFSTRRRFLKTSLVVSGAALAGPNIVRAQTLGNGKKDAANSRIGMGFIGMGLISRGHLGTFSGMKEVQPLAVCDVKADKLGEAAEKLEKRGHKGFMKTSKFEEVIANPDIDAVCVTTPDHWHVGIALAAMKAGKDVYVEKPMALTVEESKLMVEAERKYGRIVQVGTQQRSSAHFRIAANLVRNGLIGEVKEIYAQLGSFGPPKGRGRHNPQPPKTLDYDRWLGPTPYYEFNPWRVKGTYGGGWRCFWDYGSRKFGDWGAHHFDIIQWALGRDDSGPVEFIPKGFEGAEHHHYRYADGITVWRDKQPNPMMIRFIGTEGEVHVKRGGIATKPKELVRHKFTDEDVQLYESNNHRQNFIDSIKSREPTICPATIGHRSGTICYLSGIAERTVKPIQWDPKAEKVIDNAEATAMLSRERREGYELPKI
ncbi:MAG: Gfo/Idh/MocA family oxidoreductase [Akkermansiaceae bacterium]|nr:Gfo/Idh/MocA family oxidoreductase [Akkermansiaceae bacterium]